MAGHWGAAMLGAGLALVAAGAALSASPGAGPRDWAFPGAGPSAPPPSPNRIRRLPTSTRSFTQAQIGDRFHAVDWWPAAHAAPPRIVVEGRAPHLMACGYCHLPAGEGRPENAALAGLPADYIARQVADFRSGARGLASPGWGPGAFMHEVAAAASPGEVAAAAAYFSRAPFVSHVKVVEAARIPAVEAEGFVYRRLQGYARTILGERIVEGPVDFDRFELRDSRMGYVAYVPPGSIGRGRRLAATGGAGRTQPCGACHGAALAGGAGPPLAGRSPTYLYRQLSAFHSGSRAGPTSAPMKTVAARLSVAEMIDLAAYAASIRP